MEQNQPQSRWRTVRRLCQFSDGSRFLLMAHVDNDEVRCIAITAPRLPVNQLQDQASLTISPLECLLFLTNKFREAIIQHTDAIIDFLGIHQGAMDIINQESAAAAARVSSRVSQQDDEHLATLALALRILRARQAAAGAAPAAPAAGHNDSNS